MALVLLPALSGLVLGGRPAAAAQPWAWPLEGASRAAVSRAFDPPATRYGTGHRGVDLVGGSGAAVRAAGAGRVSYAGLLAGRGVVVVVRGDLRTTYEPVTATVGVGAQVAAGDVVGRLDGGHAGCPAAACLHWGLRRGEQYLDPLQLVGAGPVRLLPLDRRPLVAGAGMPGGNVPGGAVPGGGVPDGAVPGSAVPGGGPAIGAPVPDGRSAATAEAPAEPPEAAGGSSWDLRSAAAPGASLLAVALLALAALRRPGRRPPPGPVGGTAALRPEPDRSSWADVVQLDERREARARRGRAA